MHDQFTRTILFLLLLFNDLRAGASWGSVDGSRAVITNEYYPDDMEQPTVRDALTCDARVTFAALKVLEQCERARRSLFTRSLLTREPLQPSCHCHASHGYRLSRT